jgi:anti-anti-sigma regulatory factor
MKISFRQENGVRIAALAGRLDGFGAKEAETLMADAELDSPLVLDCTELSYLSSAGVRFC